MAKKTFTKVERKILDLIREARSHEAYMAQDGMSAQALGSGLEWLEFVIKQGRMRLKDGE